MTNIYEQTQENNLKILTKYVKMHPYEGLLKIVATKSLVKEMFDQYQSFDILKYLEWHNEFKESHNYKIFIHANKKYIDKKVNECAKAIQECNKKTNYTLEEIIKPQSLLRKNFPKG